MSDYEPLGRRPSRPGQKYQHIQINEVAKAQLGAYSSAFQYISVGGDSKTHIGHNITNNCVLVASLFY
jgi:hypothetical protein